MRSSQDDSENDPIARAFEELASPGVQGTAQGPSAALRTIGPYRLLRVLGEGGFGTVYLAEQTEPLRRTVALKVLRSSASSRSSIRRFDAERQALARLDHPFIASIHDAGVSDSEQPYFAMDWVDGVPITEYCDRHGLGLRERVELLRKVCLAVQHAHERGVVHRDLKPSNVLVVEVDERPLPKVIDFGIAKFEMEEAGGDQSILTLTGQIVGTPEYMSPEQTAGSARRIDGRTDVYSLGVLLYELLTGVLPLEVLRPSGRTLEETLRVIRDVDPPRPSACLRMLVVEPSESRTIGGEARALARVVRGDLDWITLRAIEKERARRYTTPLELALDLGRFLAHESVHATPPSARYLATKFARRHRGALVAASLLFASLVLGIVGTTTFLIRALASEDDAVEAALTAEQERDVAEAQRLAAEARLLAFEHPTRALLLGLEAHAITPGRAANDALYAALPNLRERHVLYGHDSRLMVTTLDPAGRRLLTAGEADRDVLLWDFETGELLHRLQRGEGATPFASFARDGEWVVTSTEAGLWTIWDAESGAIVSGAAEASADPSDPSGGPGPVLHPPGKLIGRQSDAALVLDNDGERMAMACADGLVRILDPWTGEVLRALGEPGATCFHVEFGPAGRLLVAAYADTTYRAWSLPDFKDVTRIGSPSSAPPLRKAAVAFDPEGNTFACGIHVLQGDGVVVETTEVYSVAGERVARVPSTRVLNYTTDGPVLHLFDVVGDSWKRLDVGTGQLLESVPLPPARNLYVALSRDRVIGSDKGLTRIFDARLGELDRFTGHVYQPFMLEWDRTGGRLVTGSDDRTARIWETHSLVRPLQPTSGRPQRLWPLAVTDEGPLLAMDVTARSGAPFVEIRDIPRSRTVLVADAVPIRDMGRITASGSHYFEFDPLEPVEGASFLRRPIGGLVRHDLATGERLESEVEPFAMFSIRPDGGRMVLGRSDGANLRMSFRDVETGAEVPIEHDFYPTPMISAWGVDCVVLRSASDRGVVIDARTARPRFTFSGHDADHMAYGFSHDGERLVSASMDRTAIVRDARTGEVVCSYRGIDGEVADCGFTRDGALVWVVAPGAVHLFDAESARPFARLEPWARPGETSFFAGAAPSPDDQWLWTVTTTGQLQRFPLDPVAYALSVAPRDFEPDELDEFQIGSRKDRLKRIERIVRETPTAARLSRAASLLAQLGELDRALALAEEAVARDPLERFPWFDLGRFLARRYAESADPDVRRASLERAVQVLRRARELGVDIERQISVDAFDALRDEPAFREGLDR